MAKEKYSFSQEMKDKAQKRAELFNPTEKKNTHHILPRHLGKKYDLPVALIRNDLNAIALEIDLHDWLHGKKFTKTQLMRILQNEYNELANELGDDGQEIKDSEIEWEGLDEDDFIFLAQAILGLTDEDFNNNKSTIRIRKKKKKRR